MKKNIAVDGLWVISRYALDLSQTPAELRSYSYIGRLWKFQQIFGTRVLGRKLRNAQQSMVFKLPPEMRRICPHRMPNWGVIRTLANYENFGKFSEPEFFNENYETHISRWSSSYLSIRVGSVPIACQIEEIYAHWPMAENFGEFSGAEFSNQNIRWRGNRQVSQLSDDWR